MKTLLLLLLSLLPLFGFAQSKYFVGVTGALKGNYRITTATAPQAQFIDHINDEHDIPRLGFKAGIHISRILSQKFILDVGVIYDDQGWQRKSETLIFNDPDPLFPTSVLKFSWHHGYLSIPVEVLFFPLKKQTLFVAAGGGMALNIRNIHKVRFYDGNKVVEKKKYPGTELSHYIFASAGIGSYIQLFDQTKLRLKLGYEQSVTEIYPGPNDVHHYFHSASLEAGLFFGL